MGPASDEEAFVEAFVAAYAAAWDTIGLPPMAGDCWDGDRLALSRALTWVRALGATPLDDRRQPDSKRWLVLADPEGNEFCILRSDEER